MTVSAPIERARARRTTDADGRQAAIGLGLAASIFGAWLSLHIYGVFLFRFEGSARLAAPILIAPAVLAVGGSVHRLA